MRALEEHQRDVRTIRYVERLDDRWQLVTVTCRKGPYAGDGRQGEIIWRSVRPLRWHRPSDLIFWFRDRRQVRQVLKRAAQVRQRRVGNRLAQRAGWLTGE